MKMYTVDWEGGGLMNKNIIKNQYTWYQFLCKFIEMLLIVTYCTEFSLLLSSISSIYFSLCMYICDHALK